MAQSIRSYLEKNQARVGRFLQDLIRIPTENPPGANYRECAEFLAHALRRLGMSVKIHQVPEKDLHGAVDDPKRFPRFNVVGRLDFGLPRTVHFNGHYDVVPAGGAWRFGPFNPTIERGLIYGRGAADMKGALAAVLFAIEALVRTSSRPRMNIEVSFTADEETDGAFGAGAVNRTGGLKADYAVICEGGAGRSIGVGHNGILWLRCDVGGKSAHASRPEKGLNAFDQMVQLANRFDRLKKQLATKEFCQPNGDSKSPTICLGGVFGGGPGGKINTVPASASFSIDRRIVPSETVRQAGQEIASLLREARKEIPRLRAKLSEISKIDPCVVDHEHPFCRAFADVVGRVRKGPTEWSINPGFTDMHYFVEQSRIPCVGYGPGGRNLHGVDECVSVVDLLRSAEIYAGIVCDWDGIKRK